MAKQAYHRKKMRMMGSEPMTAQAMPATQAYVADPAGCADSRPTPSPTLLPVVSTPYVADPTGCASSSSLPPSPTLSATISATFNMEVDCADPNDSLSFL